MRGSLVIGKIFKKIEGFIADYLVAVRNELCGSTPNGHLKAEELRDV